MADEIEKLEKTKSHEAIEEQQDEQNKPWDGMERRNGEDRRQSPDPYDEQERRSGEERREYIPKQ